MPSTGEKIKTPDGIAVITDVNILESTVKARLVVEECAKTSEMDQKNGKDAKNGKNKDAKSGGRGKSSKDGKDKASKENKDKQNENDKEEKLSTEIYTYKKSEIKRLGRKNSKKKTDDLEDLEEDVLREIKELMKD